MKKISLLDIVNKEWMIYRNEKTECQYCCDYQFHQKHKENCPFVLMIEAAKTFDEKNIKKEIK